MTKHDAFKEGFKKYAEEHGINPWSLLRSALRKKSAASSFGAPRPSSARERARWISAGWLKPTREEGSLQPSYEPSGAYGVARDLGLPLGAGTSDAADFLTMYEAGPGLQQAQGSPSSSLGAWGLGQPQQRGNVMNFLRAFPSPQRQVARRQPISAGDLGSMLNIGGRGQVRAG